MYAVEKVLSTAILLITNVVQPLRHIPKNVLQSLRCLSLICPGVRITPPGSRAFADVKNLSVPASSGVTQAVARSRMVPSLIPAILWDPGLALSLKGGGQVATICQVSHDGA